MSQPTPRRYFGGDSVRDNRVYQLQATTFPELVEFFYDKPRVFRMSRKDFLDNPNRDVLKDGPWVGAVSYQEGQFTRKTENADALNLVILDLDAGEFVEQIFEAPESVMDALYPWNALIYTTAKHTPEAPRLKIVVDVEPCELHHHRALVHTVLDRIGAPVKFKGIVESSTLAQPHYRPMQFLGEPNNSVLAKRTKGIPLTVDDIRAVSEESEHREFAYRGEGLDSSPEALAWLPRINISVADVEPALMAIDPDCNRNVWIQCVAALRHQFREEEQAREAFDLFDRWSSGGSKYRSNEPYVVWRSFRPDATNRRPITIGSLFKHAMDAGWVHTHTAEKIQQSVESWIQECEDRTLLLEQGCAKIASMPFLTPIVEDYLMELLRKRFTKLSGTPIEKRAIKKQMAQERFERKRIANVGAEVPAWLAPYVYISTSNVMHHVGTGTQLTPDAFNLNYSINLMPKDDDGNEEANSGRPTVLPVHYALNQLGIRRVSRTLFYPLSEEPFVKIDGEFALNTYRPSSLPMEDEDNAEVAGRLIRALVSPIIGEPEYVELFLDYCALRVQFPGKKTLWAPLIQSAEGVGKGFLGKVLSAILGAPNVRSISPETLRDRWTGWQFNTVLNILEEVHIPGDARERVTNSLKLCITDPMLDCIEKYAVTTKKQNLTNYIAFTNFLDALHLKSTDRRWFVICSPVQTKDQVEELNASGHFARMEPLLYELAGAARSWFMRRKISRNFPHQGPPPKTKYWRSLIEESKNPLLVKIEDLIEAGNPLIGEDVIHYEELSRLTMAEQRNNRKLSTYLRTLGYEQQERAEIAGVRTTVWVNARKFDDDVLDAVETLRMRFEASDKSL